MHLTANILHAQAWPAHYSALLVKKQCGDAVYSKYIAALFENRAKFKNADIQLSKADMDTAFADIAEGCGLLGGEFSRAEFLDKCSNWKQGHVWAAYGEFKEALALGVFGIPKHIVDGVLLTCTESVWGVEEWRAKLADVPAETARAAAAAEAAAKKAAELAAKLAAP
mmetsp:Transcript_18383/g.64571  ORF Transcript_18383/g.64571 Transcript_18383/m.64571 type:complete len:168 (+) Transcript_18383:216-719(+)